MIDLPWFTLEWWWTMTRSSKCWSYESYGILNINNDKWWIKLLNIYLFRYLMLSSYSTVMCSLLNACDVFYKKKRFTYQTWWLKLPEGHWKETHRPPVVQRHTTTISLMLNTSIGRSCMSYMNGVSWIPLCLMHQQWCFPCSNHNSSVSSCKHDLIIYFMYHWCLPFPFSSSMMFPIFCWCLHMLWLCLLQMSTQLLQVVVDKSCVFSQFWASPSAYKWYNIWNPLWFVPTSRWLLG